MIKYQGDTHTYIRKKHGKNYNCFCQSIQNKRDGVYKCKFKSREDHLKKQISKGIIHTCVFEKEEYDKVIEDYFKNDKEKEKVKDDIKYEDLLKKVAVLVGRKNLSLETGSSKELQDLICTSIRYGQQFPETSISSIFKKFSTDTVRESVINTSIEVNKIQFKKYGNLTFVGISCDEGSTREVHNLDFIMENPLSGLHPYPCFTSVMKNGTAVEYTEHLARGINFLKTNKIPIASLTIDGNKAQLKALSFDWRDSLRNRYIDSDDFIKHILVNHCLCHRINNAYKRAYNLSPELKTVVDHLRQLSEDCRKRPEDVLDTCPSVQLTRWVIDYDICCFILNHAQRITRFMSVDVEALQKLNRALSIFKSLTNIFEAPKTPHFKAFRIIEDAICALEQLSGSVPYSKTMAEQLKAYTIGSSTAGLWMLSYVLTPKGREDFSLRINKSTFPHKDDYSQMFNAGKLKDVEDIEAVVNASIENIPINPPEQTEENTDLSNILRPPVERLVTEVPEEEDAVEENTNHLILGPAQDYLMQILTDWGVSDISRMLTIRKFNSFVNNTDDVFAEQATVDEDYFWQNIRRFDPCWNVIGEVAMRLHSSPCSEASCERTISLQRIVLTAKRMSSKKQLLDARLTLLRGLNIE